MTRIQLDDDLARSMHEIVNSIFTDACNSGMPFQRALVAIYLSGLDHGRAALIEARQG